MLNPSNNAISAKNIYKYFGKVKALDGVDLTVESGTVFALLGPNGAGKTTLVRILTTLLKKDKGEAMVAGFDVNSEANEVRKVIGLTGQFAAVDENLTGKENMELVGRLYHLPFSKVKERVSMMLEYFDLVEAKDRKTKTYSGGMKRRLDLAASLVGDPKVLFLDEPTTGLDPKSRLGLWEIIRKLVKKGTTILLTTQYLEEADNLADRISVIDHGKVIAQGSPSELKSKAGGDVLELHLAEEIMAQKAKEIILKLGFTKVSIDNNENKIRLPVKGTSILPNLIRKLDQQNIEIVDIVFRRPTLDEVFLSLTSQNAKENDTKDTAENIIWEKTYAK